MLNVKALASAFAVTSAVAFCFYIAYGLMIPDGFQSAPAWAPLVPNFRWISAGRFLLGFSGALLLGALAGFLAGTLNNYFQRFWAMSH